MKDYKFVLLLFVIALFSLFIEQVAFGSVARVDSNRCQDLREGIPCPPAKYCYYSTSGWSLGCWNEPQKSKK